MIDLTLPARLDGDTSVPRVLRLSDPIPELHDELPSTYFARPADQSGTTFETAFGRLEVSAPPNTNLIGDVVLMEPSQGRVHRWFRAGDTQNTLLITEQCDQLCIMCSQPPRKKHDDWFKEFEIACLLADHGADVGLSGGEPTLYKNQVFRLIERVSSKRQDLSFHILSNAQHFSRKDIEYLRLLRHNTVWGVPIYAANPLVHDQIVAKVGAFEGVCDGLATLLESGSRIELRTVILKQNIEFLSETSKFVAQLLQGVECWSLMQLERQGFAKNRWDRQFHDHSLDFRPIAEAVSLTRSRGIETLLYNMPLCTVPDAFRNIAPTTISDWKRSFLPECENCADQRLCTGLFAWHGEDNPYGKWGPILKSNI